MDNINGNAPVAEHESPPLDPNQDVVAAAAFLQSAAALIISAAVKGMIMTVPAFAARSVVAACCRAMGVTVGQIFAGNLVDVLGARGECRQAFIAGLNSTPPPPANIASNQNQPQPAQPPFRGM